MSELDTPKWMQTRWGQWLARHWPPAAALWKGRMEEALLREAEFEHTYQRDRLLACLNGWALADFAAPPDEQRTGLIAAWCGWRNAAERLHAQRERFVGCRLPTPMELQGGPPMLRDDPELRKFLGGTLDA